MTLLRFCRESEREKILDELLAPYGGAGAIKRTANGKPYIAGDPVHLSISHSNGICAIALSDGPVGVDTEAAGRKTCKAVLSSFSDEERAEITCERDFLEHWTAREAYVKLIGGGIWQYFRRLSFIHGRLLLDGEPLPVQTAFCRGERAVTAVCAACASFTAEGTHLTD